jgi:stage II sporulation protein AA (anti-sigma F factor antagonist)
MITTNSYKPVGRFDGSNAAAHEKELLALLVDGVNTITIDLGELDYISSAGLRVLLVTGKAAKGKGGKVVLASPRASILEVIKMSGFDKILEVRT